MPGEQNTFNNSPYLTIVQGGFVQQVEEGTEGAQRREWKNPKTGATGVKFEIPYNNWSGIIRNIEVVEAKYSSPTRKAYICKIHFDDAIISLPTEQKYFKDFAKRIFNADLSKEVTLHPYDMETVDQFGNKKRRSGVSVKQGEEKYKNYFYDGKKTLHDFPEADEDLKDKEGYWAMYFKEVESFLIDKLKELKFEAKPEVKEEEASIDEVIEGNDLPF